MTDVESTQPVRTPTQVPNKISLEGFDEDLRKDIVSILYALALIRQETGHGTLVIEVKDSKISEMSAAHTIRPKYLKA